MAKKKQNVHKKKSSQAPQSAANKAAQRAAAREERNRKKRNRIIRITTITTVSAAAVIALGVAAYRLVQDSGVLMRTKVAAESEHYKVTNAMYCYFYDQCYQSYLDYFAENPSAIEFNTNKKLKEQQTSDGTTWHEFFLDNTNSVVQSMLQYCETAYDADFTLTDEQIAGCATRAAEMDLSGMPKGVRAEDMQKAMELELLGSAYYSQFVESISITDADINTHYEENKAEYQTWEMLCYTFAWASNNDESSTALLQPIAKQHAEALAASETTDNFQAYVRDFLINVKQKTEADADNLVSAMKLSTNGSSYSETVCDWVMNDVPEIGDTFIYEEEGQTSYQVYMLTSLPQRNESDAVDFRVVVLSHSNNDGEAAAMEKAEMLMDQWEEKGADEAAFSAIAMSYSEDNATYQDGGLVEAYGEDRTSYGKALGEWLFAAGRKPGDTTIISDDEIGNGVVLMAYYVEDNPKAVWENQVYDDLYDAAFAVLEDAKKLHLVALNEENQLKLDF